MADFLSAINSGLNKAVVAKKQNIEIYKIISELNSQVNFASKNIVGVELAEQTLPLTEGELSIARLLNGIKYRALILKHQEYTDEFKILARWQHENDGYPVNIYINKYKYECADKQSIEAVLMKIVTDPSFGSTLHNYMIKKPFIDVAAIQEKMKVKMK